jgi:hypothetical protein
VSVFLRWGVFGILGVAALMYAYNASKRLAAAHVARPAVELAPVASVDAQRSAPQPVVEPAAPPAAPARCEAELTVAQRAIDMRSRGEPLDRLLRIQEIAWQESTARRARLEAVATRWYSHEGDIATTALRAVVVNDCEQHSPAP